MPLLEKAVFFDPDEKAPSYIFVQFNPNTLEYEYGKRMRRKEKQNPQWRKKHQQQSPLDPWDSSSLSMRLFFNTYESELQYTDVRDKIRPLRVFLCKTDEKNTVCNKKIQFAWGTFAFEGFLNGLRVSYQMFGMDGTPVRAEVSLSISGEEVRSTATESKFVVVRPTNAEKIWSDFKWLFLQG